MSTQRQAEYDARRLLEKQRGKKRKKRVPVPASTKAIVHAAPCAVCGCDLRVELHHIVPRAHFRTGDATVHNKHNVMPLCHSCHQDHHTTTRRVPRRALTRDAIRFVIAAKGESWLDLWYPA